VVLTQPARLPEASHEDVFVDALLPRSGGSGRALLEARDSTIEALRARRAEIEAEAALALAVDKERKLALAEHLGVRVPISEPVRSGDDARLSGGRTGFPAVIKPVQSWVPSPGAADA
jgi:hypothetical protein